jgi:hypothetical protein
MKQGRQGAMQTLEGTRIKNGTRILIPVIGRVGLFQQNVMVFSHLAHVDLKGIG